MTVVVGFVATDQGRAALAEAVREAGRRNTHLTAVIHATRTGSAQDIDAAEDEVRQYLDSTDQTYDVRLIDHGSDIAEDLIGVANDVQADVVVIGLRRRSPVGKLILGSNAQRILLDAPCLVLAVKA